MIIPAGLNNSLQAGSGNGGNTYENILTDSQIIVTFESREVVIGKLEPQEIVIDNSDSQDIFIERFESQEVVMDKKLFEIIIEHCEC